MSETAAASENTRLSPAPKRRRWLLALLLLVVFICGGVCGAGLALTHALRRAQAAAGNSELRAEQGTRWLTRRLDLTTDQEAKVRAILRQQGREMARLRQEIWPSALERLDQTEKDISALLTPEQQKKWRETASQLRRRWIPASPAQPRPEQTPPRRLRERPGQNIPAPTQEP